MVSGERSFDLMSVRGSTLSHAKSSSESLPASIDRGCWLMFLFT